MHLLQAAKIQHFFAWRIRSELKRLGRPAKSYAIFAHTSYDRLMKMLRGEVIMRLEDLGRAELYFGLESFVPLYAPPSEVTSGPPRKSIG